MSKKNKRGKQYQNPHSRPAVAAGSNSSSPRSTEPTFQEKVVATVGAIFSRAEHQDVEQLQSNPTPAGTTLSEVERLYNELDQGRQLLDSQRARLDADREAWAKESTRLEESKNKFREAEQSLNDRREAFERRRKQLDDDIKELAESQKQLRELAADLDRREQDARFGFQSLYQVVMEEEHQRLDTFSADLARLRQEFSDKRLDELAAWQLKLAEMDDSAQQQLVRQFQDLEAQREKLAQEQSELAQQQIELHHKRNSLEAQRQILEEDRQSQKEILEQQLAARIEGYNTKIASLEALHKQAASDRDLFNKSLMAWEKVRRQVGKDPENILEAIESLTRERDQLAKELRSRPSELNLQRIEELERLQSDAELERWSLTQQNSELKNQLNRNRIQALEVESQRDLILALEARGKVLDAQLKELKTDVERRLGQQQNQSPFPQCHAFDQDPSLQDKLETVGQEDLSTLVKEIQMRIATGGLFYELRDVRSFLAGLSMSQTMILQGISGTGKTSLPLKFAEAIGGGNAVIEVQAGWRDRDDLLGHYNAFEQKFYESKFIQALYMAQCPAFSDRVYMILLDEMNLSYPEQYFADLLSVLQMDAKTQQRRIDLISAAIPSQNYPRLFINNNRSIRVPDNVWFIGTANQDETTKDIADKTYDRSHIIELPVQHPSFAVRRIDSAPQRISHATLTEAFRKARNNASCQSEATRTLKFLDSLRADFNTQYALGWGNRLKRQVEDYVPVVITGGGTWAEATDDILSMKVLRKIRNRYEIQSGDLEQLEKIVADAWKKSGGKEAVEAGLTRSIQLIREEQRKKTSRQTQDGE
jgi:hypothetical protein